MAGDKHAVAAHKAGAALRAGSAHEAGSALGARSAPKPGAGPRMVAPTTRVNFAFPFSKITVEEPGKDLAELASIVAELAAAVERAVTDPAVALVRERAEVLAGRLH